MLTGTVAGIPTWLLIVISLPGILAAGVWAVLQLPSFFLVVVLCSLVLPKALLTPAGTEVAAGDVLLVLGLGAWVVAIIVRRAGPPWIRGYRFFVPALLYVAVNFVSIAWSDDRSATLGHAIQITEIVLVFPLVFASVPTSLATVRTGLLALMSVTTVLAAFGAVKYLPNAFAGARQTDDLFGGLNKNVLGSFIAVGLVVAFTFGVQVARLKDRLLIGGCGVVLTVGLFATVSRGSVLGAFGGMLLVGLLTRRSQGLMLALSIAAGVLYLAAVGVHSSGREILADGQFAAGSYDSSDVRSLSWAHAVDKIVADPLFGSGAGAYLDYLPRFDIFLPDPNNMFLVTWAELGVLGMGTLLFMLGRFAMLVRASRELTSEAKPLALAASGAALSLLVHFQVDVTWTRGTSAMAFVMIGILCACMRLGRPPAPAAVSAAEKPGALDRVPVPA